MVLGAMGLGTSNTASFGRGMSFKSAADLFKSAYELGVCVIDTADTYGSGDSERLIANAINRDFKNDFFIITKAGFPCSSLPGWMSPLNQVSKKLMQKAGKNKNFTGNYLEKSLHQSLKRLKRDSVGAFILHEPISGDNVTDDTWASLEKIKKLGMAELVGVSSADSKIIEKGLLSKQVDIVETPISFKSVEYKKIVSICLESNVNLVANQIFLPLSFLDQNKTEKINSIIAKYGYSNIHIRNILISYAQSFAGVSTVLFGTTNLTHLQDNVSAIGNKYPNDFFVSIEKVFNS